MSAARSRHPGFTLVELIVVLAILVILATVAVNSIDGRLDQSRYEATQAGLRNIEEAIVGPANQRSPDGTRLVTGFVADIGRLPKASLISVNGADQTQPLELWDNPYGLQAFGIKPALAPNIASPLPGPAPTGDIDPEVFVACGWRGPYLHPGVGQKTLTDGWGNPYDLLQPNRVPVTLATGAVTDEINIVRSRGVDYELSTEPTGDYKEDLYVNFGTQAFTGSAAVPDYPAVAASDTYHASTLVVTVRKSDGSALDPSTLYTVKYFGPDPATGRIKVITKTQMSPATPVTSMAIAFDDPVSSLAITVGSRMIRAYTPAAKSHITRVILAPGGNQQDALF